MFYELKHICDVCGKILASYGCCVYGDEETLCKDDLCEECKKAVADATEQVKKLQSQK